MIVSVCATKADPILYFSHADYSSLLSVLPLPHTLHGNLLHSDLHCDLTLKKPLVRRHMYKLFCSKNYRFFFQSRLASIASRDYASLGGGHRCITWKFLENYAVRIEANFKLFAVLYRVLSLTIACTVCYGYKKSDLKFLQHRR